MQNILENLISFSSSIEKLRESLKGREWDAEEEIELRYNDFVLKIKELVFNKTFEEIVEWCNLLECREDIDMDEKTVDLIALIATPEINQLNSKSDILALIS